MIINRKKWQENVMTLIFILCLAFLFDGVILRRIDFSINYDIPIIDVLSIIVTLCLALYIAYVVEENKTQKKVNTDILLSILQAVLADVDSLSRQVYESKFLYSRLTAFCKSNMAQISTIINILSNLKVDYKAEEKELISLRNKFQYLRPILSDIKDKPSKDYLVVKDDYVISISPNRLSRIQNNLSDIRQRLYQIWLLTNSLQS